MEQWLWANTKHVEGGLENMLTRSSVFGGHAVDGVSRVG